MPKQWLAKCAVRCNLALRSCPSLGTRAFPNTCSAWSSCNPTSTLTATNDAETIVLIPASTSWRNVGCGNPFIKRGSSTKTRALARNRLWGLRETIGVRSVEDDQRQNCILICPFPSNVERRRSRVSGDGSIEGPAFRERSDDVIEGPGRRVLMGDMIHLVGDSARMGVVFVALMLPIRGWHAGP